MEFVLVIFARDSQMQKAIFVLNQNGLLFYDYNGVPSLGRFPGQGTRRLYWSFQAERKMRKKAYGNFR